MNPAQFESPSPTEAFPVPAFCSKVGFDRFKIFILFFLFDFLSNLERLQYYFRLIECYASGIIILIGRFYNKL